MKSRTFVVLILVSVAGCTPASGVPRVVVSGTVALDDKPVEEGQISFIPIEGSKGPVTVARIIDGKYLCDVKGGVPVGKHRIEILVWDPDAPYGGRGEPARPQWAPVRYNENSELVETIEGSEESVEKNFRLEL